ncbi:MAG: Ppx/GppA phosphatase family protein [Solirubrobacterales bacterium]|nr:Ppx/GppA phosphatase family protein [Solirubrobacterales bacterium]
MNQTPTVIATVDIGTNSTRLLVCSVDSSTGGRPGLADLERHSIVTRLGDGVDSSGRLAPEATQRVLDVLADYMKIIDLYPVAAVGGVLTSAGRDAADGLEFAERITAQTSIPVRLIGGDEEAQLSFAGATSELPRDGKRLLVCDVGGGSTELITGQVGELDFHVSLPAGVVRQSERHFKGDPPTHEELAAAANEVRELLQAQVPDSVRESVEACIAVAGTATTLSAIDQNLEPYDPTRVHGSTVTLERSRELLARIAGLPLAERVEVDGLHPDRAPTAVAGAVILCEVLEDFGLDRFEASEHDILRGVALKLAANRD